MARKKNTRKAKVKSQGATLRAQNLIDATQTLLKATQCLSPDEQFALARTVVSVPPIPIPVLVDSDLVPVSPQRDVTRTSDAKPDEDREDNGEVITLASTSDKAPTSHNSQNDDNKSSGNEANSASKTDDKLTFIKDMTEYFESKETDAARGVKNLSLRRLAQIIGISPMLRALVDGDEDTAFTLLEKRDEDLPRLLQSLDADLQKPSADKTETKSASPLTQQHIDALLRERVREAIDRIFDAETRNISRQYSKIWFNFIGQRRCYQEAGLEWRDACQRINEMRPKLDAVYIELQTLATEPDSSIIDRFASLVNEVSRQIKRIEDAEEVQLAAEQEMMRSRVTFLQAKDNAQRAFSEFGNFSRTMKHLAITLPEDTIREIATLRVTLSADEDWATEINARLPQKKRPVTIKLISDVLPGYKKQLVELKRPKMPSVFRTRMVREEELRRLMIIGYCTIMTTDKDKPRTHNSVMDVLVDAGLIHSEEQEAAKTALRGENSDTWQNLLTHSTKRIGTNWGHFYKPKKKARELASNYLNDCKDPSGLKKHIWDARNQKDEERRSRHGRR